jgi:hypothetical protein
MEEKKENLYPSEENEAQDENFEQVTIASLDITPEREARLRAAGWDGMDIVRGYLN